MATVSTEPIVDVSSSTSAPDYLGPRVVVLIDEIGARPHKGIKGTTHRST